MSSAIQAIIFKRDTHDYNYVLDWLERHKYTPIKITSEGNYWRARIREPDKSLSYYNKEIAPGINIIGQYKMYGGSLKSRVIDEIKKIVTPRERAKIGNEESFQRLTNREFIQLIRDETKNLSQEEARRILDIVSHVTEDEVKKMATDLKIKDLGRVRNYLLNSRADIAVLPPDTVQVQPERSMPPPPIDRTWHELALDYDIRQGTAEQAKDYARRQMRHAPHSVQEKSEDKQLVKEVDKRLECTPAFLRAGLDNREIFKDFICNALQDEQLCKKIMDYIPDRWFSMEGRIVIDSIKQLFRVFLGLPKLRNSQGVEPPEVIDIPEFRNKTTAQRKSIIRQIDQYIDRVFGVQPQPRAPRAPRKKRAPQGPLPAR